MAVEGITEHDDQVLFAANVDRGHPYHRLGQQVHGDMGIDEALDLIGVGDEVVQHVTLYDMIDPGVDLIDDPAAIEDKPPTYEDVDGYYGVKSSVFGIMSVAKTRHQIMQRKEVLELAYEITGLDPDGRHVDTIGNLDGYLAGRAGVFFAYIRVPDLVVDPHGVADTIERGLLVATSFDSTIAHTYGFTGIRIECSNSLNMALKRGNLTQEIKARHTGNAADRLREAARADGYIGMIDDAMKARCEDMLRVGGDKALKRLTDHFWPIDEATPKATVKRRRDAIANVKELYDGPNNLSVALLGRNGYAAYQAFVDYQDHVLPARGKTSDDVFNVRAQRVVMPGEVQRNKIKASEIVLSTVN